MAEQDEADGEAPKPPKIKAEENPWYRLATLYGVGQHDKNRRAWNRYFAERLDPETLAKLIEEKRHPKDELSPFWPEDSQEIEKAFAERSKDHTLKPPERSWLINFKDVQFDNAVNLT